MPAKKKHPRLPNGFGSIVKLSGKRANPYAVYPPANKDGEKPKALCYVSDYYVGVAVLTSLKAGTYHPGDEVGMAEMKTAPDRVYDDLIKKMLMDFAIISEGVHTQSRYEPTLKDIHEEWVSARLRTGKNVERYYQLAYERLETLHDRSLNSITRKELQSVVDTLTFAKSAQTFMKRYLTNLYNFALKLDYVDKNIALNLVTTKYEPKKKYPISDEDLQKLWDNQGDPMVDRVLLLVYSGIRVNEMNIMTVNTESWYLEGGEKTEAGKNRIVPIHSAIQPIVQRLVQGDHFPYIERHNMNNFMRRMGHLGITTHYSPHYCRHTFATLCEHYGVNLVDEKRMLGHELGDVTTGVYGHRTLEELRSEIEKIDVPFVRFCQQ